MDEDTALCKILVRAFKKQDKEATCLTIVKDFMNHNNFDRTVDELAKTLGASKEEIMDVIANSCIPCEQASQ
jgi:predicted negative regulator of RcsB-dependent stress response